MVTSDDTSETSRPKRYDKKEKLWRILNAGG